MKTDTILWVLALVLIFVGGVGIGVKATERGIAVDCFIEGQIILLREKLVFVCHPKRPKEHI